MRLACYGFCAALGLSGCFLDRGGIVSGDAGVETDAGPVHECELDVDCDDGVFCNGFELCSAFECTTGAPPACVDAITCTLDVCDEVADDCVRLPDHSACEVDELCVLEVGCVPREPCDEDADCDDGFACNGPELCDGDACAAATPPDCDDGVDCTEDACSETRRGCVNVPDDVACAGELVCDPVNGCVSPTLCTSDAECDDGNFCDGPERCISGRCENGVLPSCADAIPCTVDVCDEITDGCLRIPVHSQCPIDQQCLVPGGCTLVGDCSVPADCDDGFFCNGVEGCSSGRCTGGIAPSCSDSTACTRDLCDEAGDTCRSLPDDTLCPGNHTCDPVLGCVPECTVRNDCDDGVFCNGQEDCVASGCTAGSPPDCTDTISCTTDLCDETANTCQHIPSDAACGPNERCIAGGCVPECTADVQCDDGSFCNGAETCVSGGCAAGTAPSCGDAISCTTDLCDESGDRCRNIPNDTACASNETCSATMGCVPECTGGSDCDDGLFCNGAETCVAGGCVAGTPPSCADGISCTVDLCDESGDRCLWFSDDMLCPPTQACTSTGCAALGTSSEHPGTSCNAILAAGTSTSGVYFVDPDGAGGELVRQVYCDMSGDGGGWTLVLETDESTTAHYTAAAVGASLLTPAIDGVSKLSDAFIRALSNASTGEIRVDVPGVTPLLFADGITWSVPDPGTYPSAIEATVDLGAGYGIGVQCYDGDAACGADHWCFGVDPIPTAEHACVRRSDTPGIYLDGGSYTPDYYAARIWVR